MGNRETTGSKCIDLAFSGFFYVISSIYLQPSYNINFFHFNKKQQRVLSILRVFGFVMFVQIKTVRQQGLQR